MTEPSTPEERRGLGELPWLAKRDEQVACLRELRVMPHGPAQAELSRAPSAAVDDFGDAVAFWRQRVTQELIIRERT